MVRLPPPVRPLFPYLKPVYTAATRLVAPISLQISRRRGHPLPTAAVPTLEAAVALDGGRVFTARPAEIVTRTLPAKSPTWHPTFSLNTIELVPRVAVAELPGGRMIGPHGAVVTRSGALVQELSVYFNTTRPREHPLYLHPFSYRPVHVSGRVGVLASRGPGNYYHFLMDVIPRLRIIEQCPAVEAPDRWYVPARTSFQRELLELAGLDPDRIVDSTQTPHIVADTLIVPGQPSMEVANPPWVVSFLRDRLMHERVERVPGLGIYVGRGRSRNNRRVNNERAVVKALASRGFVAVDPGRMTVAEQIRAFGQASVIVAPHGAALANIVFASPGAALVELFPAGYALPDYWKLAGGVAALAYHYLLGTGRAAHSRESLLVTDIDVDVPALLGIVDDIMCRGKNARSTAAYPT